MIMKLLKGILLSTVISISTCTPHIPKINPDNLASVQKFINDKISLAIVYLKDGDVILMSDLDYFLEKYGLVDVYKNINKQEFKLISPMELGTKISKK